MARAQTLSRMGRYEGTMAFPAQGIYGFKPYRGAALFRG